MFIAVDVAVVPAVALRKESVDRNGYVKWEIVTTYESLSARRAWIEILAAKCR